MLHRKHHKWANCKWKGSQLCVLLCVLKSGREWWRDQTKKGPERQRGRRCILIHSLRRFRPPFCRRPGGWSASVGNGKSSWCSFFLSFWSWKLRAYAGSNTSRLSPGESFLLERAAPELPQWPGVVLLAGDRWSKHMACVEPFTFKSLKNITLK